jgi:P4 family phage/plasmid primase-like protien
MTEQQIQDLVNKGRKIFPIAYGKKKPLKEGWKKCVGDTNDQLLSELFTERSRNDDKINYGMACGQHSGVLTIDLDFKHPEAEQFWVAHESELRVGVVVNTGKGKHCHFNHPATNARVISSIGGICQGVDLLCDTKEVDDSRLVIIPESLHPSGATYHYDAEDLFGGLTLADDLPDLPFPLEDLINDRSQWTGHSSEATPLTPMIDPATWYAENPHVLFSVDPFDDEPILEGNRNNDMAKIAGKLVYMNEGNDNYIINDLVDSMNEVNAKRCDPMLPDEEINQLCDSIWKTAEKRAKLRGESSNKAGLDGFKFNFSPDDMLQDGAIQTPGQAFSSGVIPCPEYQPDSRQEPNKAAIWVLHQPPYAPSSAGADHDLVFLGSEFYCRHDNVWRLVPAQSVEANFQMKYLDAKKSEISNMIAFAKNYLYLPVKSLPFWKSGGPTMGYPADPRKVISFANGMFDVDKYIKTGKINDSLLPFTDNMFSTVKLPYKLDETAQCPEWKAFLSSIWGSATCDRAEALREWMGHMLIPDITQQKIAIFHGVPRSGKSTIGKVIHRVVGLQNTAATSLNAISTDFGSSGLVGKTMAIMFDAHLPPRNLGDKSLETLKSISGGDPQVINRKFHDPYTMTLSCRFTMICNEIPKLRDGGNALLARLIPFRFTESFIGRERQDLESMLYRELEGIAIWAIEGIKRYIARGSLMKPREAVEDIQEIKRILNPVAAFGDDCLHFPTDPKDEVLVGELHRLYIAWCDDNHITYVESKDRFLSKLKAICPYARNTRRNGQQFWSGVKLREEAKAQLDQAQGQRGSNLF